MENNTVNSLIIKYKKPLNKIKTLLMMGIISGLFSCKKTKDDVVLKEFKNQIAVQGLKIDSIDDTELIYIQKGETTLKISLNNLRKDYNRDKDKSIIADFVKIIADLDADESYSWNSIKENVFISLYPYDYKIDGLIFESVTDSLNQIYVVNVEDKFDWVLKEHIEEWDITENQLKEQALKNGNKIAKLAQLKTEEIEGRKLGYIDTEYHNLESAILLSDAFKLKIESEFGFPYYFVIPNRDFCYIFSKNNFDFFSKRIGNVVLEEFNNSSYPLSTEIIEVSQNKLNVVGAFK